MSYAQGGDDAGFAIFFYIFLLYYILLSIFFISYLEVYRNYILCIEA